MIHLPKRQPKRCGTPSRPPEKVAAPCVEFANRAPRIAPVKRGAAPDRPGSSIFVRTRGAAAKENSEVNINEDQKKWIEDMLRKRGLNEFGDPKGTMYAGGTPLFEEHSGKMWDRFEYILSKHRDWLPQSKGK